MYLTKKELSQIPFKSIRDNVLISDKCSIYNPENISIGDNVTIKDFCILSAGVGGIFIGSNATIEPYTSLRGAGRIEIQEYVIISSKVEIISSTNDYQCDDHTQIFSDKIILEKHCIIGCGSVILAGSIIGTNSAIGAMSLVSNYKIGGGELWAGVPGKRMGNIFARFTKTA